MSWRNRAEYMASQPSRKAFGRYGFEKCHRGKKEPEDYVRRRHVRSSNLEFGKTPVYKINTDQPLDKTVLEIKKAIWNAL